VVALLGRAIDYLEDQLGDLQAAFQDDRERAGVPDLQLDGIANPGRVGFSRPEAGMKG